MKLNINNYIFTYKNVDITKLEVKYRFSNGSVISFNDKIKEKEIPFLEFYEIKGIGNDNKSYDLYLNLKISKKEILSIEKNKMIDYSNKDIVFETYLNIDDETTLLHYETGYSTYANPSTMFIGNTKEDKIIFKLSIPEDELFIWFELKKDEL